METVNQIDSDRFLWASHCHWILVEAIPLAILMLLAMIFEFNDGPAEAWWSSFVGGWGPEPWADCLEWHRHPMVRQDRSIVAKMLFKIILIVLGFPLKAIGLFLILIRLNWGAALKINRLLYGWGAAGAFVGVPEWPMKRYEAA